MLQKSCYNCVFYQKQNTKLPICKLIHIDVIKARSLEPELCGLNATYFVLNRQKPTLYTVTKDIEDNDLLKQQTS